MHICKVNQGHSGVSGDCEHMHFHTLDKNNSQIK